MYKKENLLTERGNDIEAGVHRFLESGGLAVSFDVFDTLITRRVIKPSAIFAMMEKRMVCSGEARLSSLPFYRIRTSVESALYKNKGHAITLMDIYRQIGVRLSLDDAILTFLMKEEIRLEEELSVAIPRMVRLANSLVDRGINVFFTSDMYLSSEIIERLLVKAGVRVSPNSVHVSSELMKSKSDGKLYDWIVTHYGIQPSRLLHIGDNPVSDLSIPHGKGIVGLICLDARPSQRELDLASAGSVEGQLLAGASRSARLKLQGSEDEDTSTMETARLGIEVAGPIFCAYVGWVLATVKTTGNSRVYFVARDGQVFLEIAKILTSDSKNETNLRYLYGSRQAWHLPAIRRIDEHVIEWLCERDPYLCLNTLAERLEMEVDSLVLQLHKNGLRRMDPTRRMNSGEINELKRILSTDSMSDFIVDHASAFRDRVIGYFKQEGVFDEETVNIVDIGWNGRMQDSLVRILEGKEILVNGLYFGLRRAFRPTANSRKSSFFYGQEDSFATRVLGDRMCGILEIIASADHGSTKGYAYNVDLGNWEPVLYDSSNLIAIKWGLRGLRAGITSYAIEYHAVSKYLDFSGSGLDNVKGSIHRLMNQFYHRPDAQEAKLIGGFLWNSDQNSAQFRTFAPTVSGWNAFRFVFSLDPGRRMMITSWLQATRAQSGKITRLVLAAYLVLKSCSTIASYHSRDFRKRLAAFRNRN